MPTASERKFPLVTTADDILQRQLDAYNARDADALSALYADDAQQFDHPDKLLASGRTQIKARFARKFEDGNRHAQILNRIAMGSFVVDHERITRTLPQGVGIVEVTVIYEIANGKIARVWFIRSGEEALVSANEGAHDDAKH